MKKVFVIVSCILVLFTSCKKEKSDNYHVSFSVNGVTKTYTGYVAAHTENVSGDIELIILGANTMTSFDDNIGIYINNYPGGGNIPAGEYRDNSTSFTVLSTYENIADGNSYESGQTVAENAIADNVTIANHFKVNITSMDSKTAKGTFSGDYYVDGDVHNQKITITNGDFYVKFQ